MDGGSRTDFDRQALDGKYKMSTKKEVSSTRKRSSSIFIGALLGLYYGIFYQPAEVPDFSFVLELAVFAAFVTIIIRTWKKKFPFKIIMKEFLITLATYLIFLLALAVRRYAYDLYGKPLVILETTASGAVLGWLFSRKAPSLEEPAE